MTMFMMKSPPNKCIRYILVTLVSSSRRRQTCRVSNAVRSTDYAVPIDGTDRTVRHRVDVSESRRSANRRRAQERAPSSVPLAG